MNIFTLLNRGIANSGVEARKKVQFASDMESIRAKWLNALLVDEMRAWMSIGESSVEILTGLCAMLGLAGFCKDFDGMKSASAEVRVIRGAISAAQQCASEGCQISVQHALAFKSACRMAREILEVCTHDAMVYATDLLNKSLSEASHAIN